MFILCIRRLSSVLVSFRNPISCDGRSHSFGHIRDARWTPSEAEARAVWEDLGREKGSPQYCTNKVGCDRSTFAPRTGSVPLTLGRILKSRTTNKAFCDCARSSTWWIVVRTTVFRLSGSSSLLCHTVDLVDKIARQGPSRRLCSGGRSRPEAQQHDFPLPNFCLNFNRIGLNS